MFSTFSDYLYINEKVMDTLELSYEFFDTCTSLSDAARKIFEKDDYRSCEKIKKLAEDYGFDWKIWSERRKKKTITVKCLCCGKEIEPPDGWKTQRKFCSSSCAATYNNKARGAIKHETHKECVYCGKKLTGKHKYAKFCSGECEQNFKQEEYIKRWKNGEESGIKGKYDVSNRIRKYLFDKYDCKCQKCGWGEENRKTHKIPLQIHHIDGDCLNNKEENLELLCPNCHSLTDTFGNSNKKSKRVFRKQKENL